MLVPTIAIEPPDFLGPARHCPRRAGARLGGVHQRQRRGHGPPPAGGARARRGRCSSAAAWPPSAPRRRTRSRELGAAPRWCPGSTSPRACVERLRGRGRPGRPRAAPARGGDPRRAGARAPRAGPHVTEVAAYRTRAAAEHAAPAARGARGGRGGRGDLHQLLHGAELLRAVRADELPRLLGRRRPSPASAPSRGRPPRGCGLATHIVPERLHDSRARRRSRLHRATHFGRRKGASACRSPSIVPAGFASRRCCASMVRETALRVDDFVYPLFVVHGRGVREPIGSMPGPVPALHRRAAARSARTPRRMGIPGRAPVRPARARRTRAAREAYAEDGIIQQAVRAVKDTIPDLLVDHRRVPLRVHEPRALRRGRGRRGSRTIPTLELIARTAVSHAEAGADMVAPSDMMDGRVGAIREALDESGFPETPIMAYSAKYASALLRAVPRGGGLHPAVRRPALVPDGPRQRASRRCARSRSTWTRAPTS